MKKLLFSLVVLGCWLGIASAAQAQGTPVMPPPATPPLPADMQPRTPVRPVTLDVEASSRKATKQKPELKTSKPKTEQKKSKPTGGTGTGRANG
ncbi:hypothetical protein [Hymenobacter sp. YC55]|uniref:hypothetical protein n=1 Tax=Hymenobacter sp. YC55 TaxID=3034019 RepID=UPI0023FA1AC1|nr:hypothetical protein [Hymenobacter sp. YC55]MDF7812573.1 hypothetical protein [Hymenobacter sp. YC55]